ncbi:hypothetical protein LOC68_07800 [Blastopirellula sp. JC732]|uniref:Uncharacterized protein n=1 Tax=Blastopirellula sediminis TaxID=2894196 RepID=A0A9X1ML83_9BACT|nr:hypothetical protein [Blastopirellula sediminis]MCC9608928.1 hypothetical protein [Blastopirellula sediminis]MCC9628295.1 hypothetical protein [Blastopirellula sediminis]
MKLTQLFAGQAMRLAATGLLALSLASFGCTSGGPAPTKGDAHGDHDHGDHEHPSEGPHGGSLIELGNEEYHAELIHDEKAGSVTIYILDSAAKAAIPIEATELTINLKHDRMGEQFKVAAAPDAGDPEGKSSKFVSTDAELAEDLDHEGADAQLVVTIDGKQFRGAVAHDHDHDHAH